MKSTKLPKEAKDIILDKGYDRKKPYIQKINNFIQDSSLLECLQVNVAAARALRNSDYVDPEIKAELLEEIMAAWIKPMQVLVLLSPILAHEKSLFFENILFLLTGFSDDLVGEKLWLRVLQVIPGNVVSYHEKDLASGRIAPLLQRFIDSTENQIGRYIAASCLIRQRPTGWFDIVKKYALSLNKNSFFLMEILAEVRIQHKHGFCSGSQKKQLEELMITIVAKHDLGAKKPSSTLIKKVGKKVLDVFSNE